MNDFGDLSMNAAYASHHVAFYHDCPTMRQQTITSGHQLCLFYHLVASSSINPAPFPSSCAYKSNLDQLKMAAAKWAASISGHSAEHCEKLVIVTSDDADNKVDRDSMVKLLCLAQSQGIDLDYGCGSVHLRETFDPCKKYYNSFLLFNHNAYILSAIKSEIQTYNKEHNHMALGKRGTLL